VTATNTAALDRNHRALSLIGSVSFLAVQVQPPAEALCPERALLVAVLDDAVGAYLGYQRMTKAGGWRRTPVRHRDHVEAAEFLFSDDQFWPFSFVNCCRHVDLDCDAVRRALRQQWLTIEPEARVRWAREAEDERRRKRAAHERMIAAQRAARKSA
jgi:hypothetical protein